MLQLHVWGNDQKLALIDAESLAAAWYLALVVPKEEFEIVTSSNVNISKSGKLPSLQVADGTSYSGYLEIIRYLNTQNYDLDEFLGDEARAVNNGLLYYIQESIQKLTDYTLFLNKNNFEQYSRAIFKHYLPFPMQYNAPIQFRALAKEKCSTLGLSVEDKTEVEEEMLKNVPTVSKVQKLKHESMIEEKLVIKNSLTNMRCLNLLKGNLEVIDNLKKEQKSKVNIFDNEKLASSDLLLLAHLFIQTNEALPDQFVTAFLEKFQPQLLEFKSDNLVRIEEKLKDVTIKQPTFAQSPNLFNAIRDLII